jgi:hypothetical protein
LCVKPEVHGGTLVWVELSQRQSHAASHAVMEATVRDMLSQRRQ